MGACASDAIRPFSGGAQRGTRAATTMVDDNCQNGGVLTKVVELATLLGSADGATFTTPASATVSGDFLRIQPIEGAIRVHNIFFFEPALAQTAGYGQIRKNRKQIQPTLDGSFDSDVVCAQAVNLPLRDGIGAWINPFNPQCINVVATNDSPIDVALSGGAVAGLCAVLVYEYL